MAVSTMFDTGRKYIVWHYMVFLKAQEINLQGICKAANVRNIAYFIRTFLFYEKVPSPFDLVAFFSKYFYLTPRDVFNDLN